MGTRLVLFLTMVGIAQSANVWAATWYVDHAGGSDANNGQSPESAWKHCPGDPHAADVARSTVPGSGDTVLFRGGVHYRGSIDLDRYGVQGGSPGSPLILKGDGWGTEKAIMDGSDVVVTPWTRCRDAPECGGNPNFASIWYTTGLPDLPSAFVAYLHEGDELLRLAQHPAPGDPIYSDNIEEWLVPDSVSTTELVDSRLASMGGETLVGRYVRLYEGNNETGAHLITGWSAAKSSISYQDIGRTVYTGTEARFALANHPRFMTEGSYVHDETAPHKTYIWPRRGDPNHGVITVSRPSNGYLLYGTKSIGINLTHCRYVTVEGFLFQKYADKGNSSGGNPVGTPGNYASYTSDHLIIVNNVFRHNQFDPGFGYGVFLTFTTDSLIQDNDILDSPDHAGIYLGDCTNTVVRNNRVTRVGPPAIKVYGSRQTQVVHNTVQDCKARHSNGLTFYQGNDGVLVGWNLVTRSNMALTMSESRNLWFYQNVLDGAHQTGYVVANWGGMSGTTSFINNTIVRSDSHFSVFLGSDQSQQAMFVIKNTVMDGAGNHHAQRDHNIYVGLAWNQRPDDGWTPSQGEQVDVDPASIFMDAANGDWRLKPGSSAIGTGADISSLLPTSLFPDVAFNPGKDIGASLVAPSPASSSSTSSTDSSGLNSSAAVVSGWAASSNATPPDVTSADGDHEAASGDCHCSARVAGKDAGALCGVMALLVWCWSSHRRNRQQRG